jgi:enoyl-CoA hydratase/carnithine racemase
MNPSPAVSVHLQGHVATVLMCRPPLNFVDLETLTALAQALDDLDAQEQCRAVVLGAQGKSFCAGADFSGVQRGQALFDTPALYAQAMRLFRTRKPIVAAVHGPAIGAGAGLTLVADFRITCPAARFGVPFNRLGFHPGMGMSYTLPRLVGHQLAARLFYTAQRLRGEQMVQLGIADELVPDDQVLARAQALASEIACSAPQAVQSTRATLRAGLAEGVQAANAHEWEIQRTQFASQDFIEGVAAAAQRRLPVFTGR